jgi:hypothetical protein
MFPEKKNISKSQLTIPLIILSEVVWASRGIAGYVTSLLLNNEGDNDAVGPERPVARFTNPNFVIYDLQGIFSHCPDQMFTKSISVV